MPSDGLAVGIPTLNQSNYIGETIESLLRQSRPPDEIVVSDHHSTDDTAQVVASFGSRVRYVLPPAGTTYGGQWNFTLSQLQSRWITLLSSDDIAYPNYIETLLRGSRRTPNAVLVRAAWEDIDPQGAVLRTHHLLTVRAVSHPRRNLLEQQGGPKTSFAAFAVRRDAWQRAGGVPEQIESLNDWAFFVRLAPWGDFVYEPEVIAGYRVGHDGDKYRRRLAMWLRDERRIFTEIFPEAAARLKMTNTKWIGSASRREFVRFLCQASEHFSPAERAPLIEAFAPWADSVGEGERMRLFQQGETLPVPLWLGERIRAKMRPLYARLKR